MRKRYLRPMAVLLLALLLGDDAPSAQSAVRIGGQRAQIKVDIRPPQLVMDVMVENTHAFGLVDVEIGLAAASSPELLEGLAWGKLYGGKEQNSNIVLKVHSVVLAIPPKSKRPASASLDLQEEGDAPAAFRTHLLGYLPADDVSVNQLLALLDTPFPADERAAVRYIGVLSEKERFARRTALASLRPYLIDFLATPIAQKPERRDALRFAWGVRALGIAGGDEAVATLSGLANKPEVARFDEPLQVILVAQVVGSVYENAGAYLLPKETKTMTDVVEQALEDAKHVPQTPVTQVITPAPETSPTEENTTPIAFAVGVGMLTGMLSLALMLKLFRKQGPS